MLKADQPGEPNGSKFKRGYLASILDVAEKPKIPIIADGIYGYKVRHLSEPVLILVKPGTRPLLLLRLYPIEYQSSPFLDCPNVSFFLDGELDGQCFMTLWASLATAEMA